VFVWRAPLPRSLVARLDVEVGAWGYENVVIYEFERAGWTVGNPCQSIRTYAAPAARRPRPSAAP